MMITEAHKTAAHKYAIAFGHGEIGLLECNDDALWHIMESFSIMGLSVEEIDAEFTKVAETWTQYSSPMAACLPIDVVQKISSETELSDDQLRKDAHNHLKFPAEKFSIVAHKPFDYYVFDHEHVNLTLAFLSKHKIKPKEIGVYDFANPLVEPIFFDINLCKKPKNITKTPKTTNQMAFNFDQGQNSAEDEEPLVSQTAPLQTPSLTSAVSSKSNAFRYFLPAILLIIIALAGYYGWKKIAPIPTSEIETTTPIQAPTETLVRPLPDPVIPLPPLNFPTVPRPGDHENIVNQIEIDQASLVLESPNFHALGRPSDQATYIEKFLKGEAGTIDSPAANITGEPSLPEVEKPIETSPILIGISGATGKLGALIQDSKGKFHRAKVGDVIDGWKIEAISKKEVVMRKDKEKQSITVPSG